MVPNHKLHLTVKIEPYAINHNGEFGHVNGHIACINAICTVAHHDWTKKKIFQFYPAKTALQ